MTGRTRLAVTLAAAALLVAPLARARDWLGGPFSGSVEVEVPADAISPGPAQAEASLEALEGPRSAGWRSHRIRFQMPNGPTKLVFWTGHRSAGERISVRVWDDSGRSWETQAVAGNTRAESTGEKLFLGTADQLAELSRAVHSTVPDEADRLVGGFQLTSLDLGSPATCRVLAAARIVLVAATQPGDAERLRLCAARGASILAVGRDAAGGEDLLSGHSSLWGAGRYGWAQTLGGTGVALRELAQPLSSARDLPSEELELKLGLLQEQRALLRSAHYERSAVVAEPQNPGGLVPSLLGVYVLALACVGLWGISRPRRAVALWIAFPTTAAFASAALAIAGVATDPAPSRLDVGVMELVAPTGEGLAAISLDLRARSFDTFDVSLPWKDGDLESLRREAGFGSPFGPALRSPAAVEDRLAGGLTLEGIQLNRRTSARVDLVQPATGQVPLLARSSSGWEISNPTGAMLRQVVLVVAGKRASAAHVEPGERRAVTLGDTSQGDPGASWVKAIDRWGPEKRLPAGDFLLAAEFEGPPNVTVTPAVAVEGRRVSVVLGPVPEVRAEVHR